MRAAGAVSVCAPGHAKHRPLATGISIYVSPNPASADDRVSVFGQLLGLRKHAPACGVPVALWHLLPAGTGSLCARERQPMRPVAIT